MLNRLKKGFEERRDQSRKHSGPEHVDQNQGFLCPECLQMLETPEGLQKHFEAEHTQPPAYSDSSSGNVSPDSGHSSENSSYHQSSAATAAAAKITTETNFICPQCLVELGSSEELSSHFQALHEGNPNLTTSADFTSLRHELNDIRASLKEEKWYSNELKKELAQLQTKITEKHQVPSGEDELAYCQQQIQVLEAGKALVTSQMLTGDKEIAELKRTCESLKREKDRITQKTLAMSREHAGMKAQWDEQMGEKLALGEELIKLKAKLKSLMAQLDQRPSEDDVVVLRAELVRSQTLLDDMRQVTEVELADWKRKCADLTDKNQTLEILLESLTSAKDDKQKSDEVESSSVKEELVQLKAELTDKSEKLDEAEVTLMELREKLDFAQAELAELQQMKEEAELSLAKQSEELEDSRTKFQAELLQSKSEVDGKLQEELVHLKSELSRIAADNQQKQSEKEVKLAAELDQLGKKLAKVEVEKQLQTEAEVKLKAEMSELQSKLENLERSNAEKSENFTQLQADLEVKNRLVTQLESEKTQMYQKIQDGEGVSAGLQQLLSEKESLQQQIKEKETKMAELKVEFEEKLAVPYRLLQEVKSQARDNLNVLGEENSKLKRNLDELKQILEGTETEAKTQVTQLTEEIAVLKANLIEIQHKSELSVAEAQVKLAHSTEENTKLQSSLNELRGKLERFELEFKSQAELVADLYSQIKTKTNSIEKFTIDLTQSREDVHHKTEELKTEKEMHNSQKAEVAKLNEKNNQLEKKLADLENQLELQKGENISRVALEKSMELELENSKLELGRLAHEIAQLKLEVIEEKELNSSNTHKINSQAKLIEDQIRNEEVLQSKLTKEMEDKLKLIQDLSQMTSDKESLSGKLSEVTEKLVLAEAASLSLQNRVEKLELSQSEREMEISKLESSRNSLMTELDDRNGLLEQARIDLDNLHKDNERIMTELTSEIEHKKLLEVDNLSLKNDLTAKTAQLDQLGDSLAQLRLELQSEKDKLKLGESEREEISVRLEQAVSQMKDLQSEISGLNEEKRNLLERYVELEEQLEFERSRVIEVRRAYDGAVAAMQELGRENQSLQIDTAKKLDRRWQSDSEALNCANCGVKFSLTVRKHHCRSCGLIFCSPCTGQSAMVGASKRPSRVCQCCHDEIVDRDSRVKIL